MCNDTSDRLGFVLVPVRKRVTRRGKQNSKKITFDNIKEWFHPVKKLYKNFASIYNFSHRICRE